MAFFPSPSDTPSWGMPLPNQKENLVPKGVRGEGITPVMKLDDTKRMLAAVHMLMTRRTSTI